MDDKSLYDRLCEYTTNAIPFHMPGHKRNTATAPYLEALRADIDITEINGFDNLNDPKGILADSEALASKLFCTNRSHYLVNGSTQGILASVSAVLKCAKDGKKRIICARNCHKSVYNALMINCAQVDFIMPETDDLTGVMSCIDPHKLDAMLEKLPDTLAVIITSPTYEGVISDIKVISESVKKHGAYLIVDSAHGAHLGLFHVFAESARDLGADIVIESLHKTLPSLTQTAILHEGDIPNSLSEMLRYYVTAYGTSSPSYLLISSIDSCIRLLLSDGEKLLSAWKARNKRFFESVKDLENLYVINPFENKTYNRDVSKIIILSKKLKTDGKALADKLRMFNIETEMAVDYYTLAMTGLGDTDENLEKLLLALHDIDKTLSGKEIKADRRPCYTLPKRVLSMQDALCPDHVDAMTPGTVCRRFLWAYPPGIPIITPGEVFDENILKIIESSL